jgi:hypothetical protein
VFIAVFERRGVNISAQQVRAPIGLEKRDHICALAAHPAMAKQ